MLSYDDLSITHLNFPDNLELLKVGSRSSFWDLKIPLSQQFLRLAELNLDFHAQINEKYIDRKLLHLPILKTLKVSGVVYLNTKLICGILESNPIVAAFSIYTMELYESLESLYRNMSHVKLLDISYQNMARGTLPWTGHWIIIWCDIKEYQVPRHDYDSQIPRNQTRFYSATLQANWLLNTRVTPNGLDIYIYSLIIAIEMNWMFKPRLPIFLQTWNMTHPKCLHTIQMSKGCIG